MQTIPLDPVLADVEAFLEQTGMNATAFGRSALNDPTLVHELRRGRECKLATRDRIRSFMAATDLERLPAREDAA